MYYKKLISGNTIIEFHNNWLGVETVIVNSGKVSEKSSVWGTSHYFSVIENGHTARYILTTKVNSGLQILIDLSKDGHLIQENVLITMGGKNKGHKEENKSKKIAIQMLQEYDMEEALAHFKNALVNSPRDPAIYFHMACANSILERTQDGYECLKKAVEFGLPDREMILNHDMLAFLRIQDMFEDFYQSGFAEYDKE